MTRSAFGNERACLPGEDARSLGKGEGGLAVGVAWKAGRVSAGASWEAVKRVRYGKEPF